MLFSVPGIYTFKKKKTPYKNIKLACKSRYDAYIFKAREISVT